MRKAISTITITMLLIMPLLLAVPLPAIAEPTEALSDAVGGGTGGEFWLDPSILYTGGVTITGDTRIYGQGAMIDLQDNDIEIVGAYLYIERCTITNGTDDCLYFHDDATGFVYNNIIAYNSDDGICIEDCDEGEIVIKENSIIQNLDDGIVIEESTDILILENTIANNDYYGINIDNEDLLDEDPNALQNIRIKGNKIIANDDTGIYAYYANGLSIASNLIAANYEAGIEMYYCPIVSIIDNKILANEYEGIYFDGDDDWPTVDVDGEDVDVLLSLTISRNKIMGNYYTDSTAGGIEIYDTQNVVITYNEIMYNYYVGIYLDGYDQDFLMEPIFIAYNVVSYHQEDGIYIDDYVSETTIIFNKIMGNYDDGLYVSAYNDGTEDDYGQNLLIKGNIIKGNMDDGMYVEYWRGSIVIEWNTILGNEYYNVYLYDLENVQFLYNTIMYEYDEEYGLKVDGCDGGRFAFNTLAYNTYYNFYITNSEGVVIDNNEIIGAYYENLYVSSCDDITIINNIITDSNDYNLELSSSSGLVQNNIIGYLGSGPISGSEYGIYLGSAEPVTVDNNMVYGNEYGIYCTSSGSDTDPVLITKNYIASNVYGIYITDDSDPKVGGTSDNRNYIIRNFLDGVYVSETSEPVIIHNNIYENIGYGIRSEAVVDIDATDNWWGDISGPGDPAEFGVGPGSGDEISQNIEYSPWLIAPVP